MTTTTTDMAQSGVAGVAPYAADVDHALEALSDQRDDLDAAQLYRDGTQPERFTSDVIRRIMARARVTWRVNMAGAVVDAISDRLEWTGCQVSGDETAQAALDDVLGASRWDLEAPDAVRDTLTLGRGVLAAWPRAGADIGEDGAVAPQDVRLTWADPRQVLVVEDPETEDTAYAARTWVQRDGRHRLTLVYPDVVVRLVGRDKGKVRSWRDLEPYSDDVASVGPWPVPNPYGRVPYHVMATDMRAGAPVHARAMPVQDILDKLVIGHMTGVDHQGLPQRYQLVNPTARVGDIDDLLDEDADDDGTPEADSTSRPRYRSEPGSVWFMEGDEVGQFATADSAQFTGPLEVYGRLLSVVSRTPAHILDPSGGAPSGESRRRADAPLVKLAARLQALFGAALADACQDALAMCGHPDVTVTVTWDDPASTDDADYVGFLDARGKLGVPHRQALLELGVPDTQVDEWLGVGVDWSLDHRVDTLARVATAARDLGTAVATGVIDAAAAQALVDTLVAPGG
jgi:hypothetical protein